MGSRYFVPAHSCESGIDGIFLTKIPSMGSSGWDLMNTILLWSKEATDTQRKRRAPWTLAGLLAAWLRPQSVRCRAERSCESLTAKGGAGGSVRWATALGRLKFNFKSRRTSTFKIQSGQLQLVDLSTSPCLVLGTSRHPSAPLSPSRIFPSIDLKTFGTRA